MNNVKGGRQRAGAAFDGISRARETPDDPAPAKLALLLPDKAPLRLLRRAAELAAVLMKAQAERGETLEIAIGLAEPDDLRWRRREALIRARAPAAIVRHLAWTPVPLDNARRMFADLDPALDFEGLSALMVPRDWGWNFQDCSVWLCLADPAVGPVLPLRPIVYYSLGLPERYVPDIVAETIHDAYWTRQVEAFRMWRQATVLTSDPTALVDLISYAGVRSDRTELIPDVIEMLPPLTWPAEDQRDRGTLIWVTRGNAADDLEASLSGLQIYYREGGALNIILAEEEMPEAIGRSDAAKLPADLRELYENLECVKYRSLEEFDRLLVRSGALWSSEIAGGAGEHLLEAERAGLHVVAASFPLTRQLVERRNLSAILYEPGNSLAIADALKELEERATTPLSESPDDSDPASQREAFAFLLDWLLAMTRAQ